MNKEYTQSGSFYKGYFPSSVSIQQIIDWASSGWDIHVGSGTFSGTLSMKSGVNVIGESPYNTIINGNVNFAYVNNSILQDVRVSGYINIDFSNNIDIKYVNLNVIYPTDSDIRLFYCWNTSSYDRVVDSYDCPHIDIDGSNFENVNTAVYYGGSDDGYVQYANFCENNIDLNGSNHYGYIDATCENEWSDDPDNVIIG